MVVAIAAPDGASLSFARVMSSSRDVPSIGELATPQQMTKRLPATTPIACWARGGASIAARRIPLCYTHCSEGVGVREKYDKV